MFTGKKKSTMLTLESLETRQLLSVWIDNGFNSDEPDYFAVEIDDAGSSRESVFAGTDTIFDYFAYLEIGGQVYKLDSYASEPVANGNVLESSGEISLAEGSIKIDIESRIPAETQTLINEYTISATGTVDLRDARLFQYLDADIHSVSDDVLLVTGSVAGNNLNLTTIDPPTQIKQMQTIGLPLLGAVVSGFGAEQYSNLKNHIESGSFDPPVEGMLELTQQTFENIGTGYGPNDITSAIEYTITNPTSAVIRTALGASDIAVNFPDLKVTHVSEPVAVRSGESLPVEWIVQNDSQVRLEGSSWIDTVYLSEDSIWDSGDMAVASQTYSLELGTEEVYRGSATIDTTDIEEGVYYIIVKADSDEQVNEGRLEANNVRSSDSALWLGIPELEPGETVNANLTDSNNAQYYVIDVEEGEHLQVSLNDANNLGANELYIQYGEPPTRTDYDARYSDNLAADQQVSIPQTHAGLYYVMVYGESIPDEGTYGITAELKDFMIMDASPDEVGNQGRVTFDVSGVKFTGDTMFELKLEDGTVISPVYQQVANPGSATVTFDLQGVDEGEAYLQAVKDGSDPMILDDAINIVSDYGSNIEIDIAGLTTFRLGRESSTVLEVSNTGLNDSGDLMVVIETPSGITVSADLPQGMPMPGGTIATPYLGIGVNRMAPGETVRIPLSIQSAVAGLEDISVRLIEALPLASQGSAGINTPVAQSDTARSGDIVYRRPDSVPPVGHVGVVVVIDDQPYVVDAMPGWADDPLNANYDGGIRQPMPLEEWIAEGGEENYAGRFTPAGWTAEKGEQIKEMALDLADQELNGTGTNYWFEGIDSWDDLSPILETTGQDDNYNCIGFAEHLLDEAGIGVIDESWMTTPGSHYEALTGQDWGVDEWQIVGDQVSEYMEDIFTTVVDTMEDIYDGAIDWFNDLYDDVTDWWNDFREDWNNSWDTFEEWIGDWWHETDLTFEIITSWDPNEKAGPSGAGENNYINPGESMPYTVFFENDPDLATASAQEVRITDVIDANLDISTLEFTEFNFGDTTISLPDNTNYYHDTVDLRPDMDLLVEIEAGIDSATRTVSWSFKSLDPDTLTWPSDPFAGFLPTNDDTHRGEGHVSYTISQVGGLVSGDVISNIAEIVFDVNDPIVTNTYVNTIDAEAPASEVAALPSIVDEGEFDVSWSFDDGNGSGVKSCDIYVSENSGPFELWLEDTTELTATFEGEVGSIYAFYSIATDETGQVESVPETADTQTQVLSFPEIEVSVAGGVDLESGVSGPVIFDYSVMGRSETSVTFTVSNTGPGVLMISDLELPDGFSVVEGLDAVIASGQQDNFTVQLDSELYGYKSGSMIITNSDDDEGMFSIDLGGQVMKSMYVVKNKTAFYDTDSDYTQISLKGPGTLEVLCMSDEPCDPSIIILDGTTDKSSLVITTKGRGSETNVDSIVVNGSLKGITAKSTNLYGEIDITGSLSSLNIGDVNDESSISVSSASSRGLSVKAGYIGEADLEFVGMLKNLATSEISGGDIKADYIKTISAKTGSIDADVESVTGNIDNVKAKMGIYGSFYAAYDIGKIMGTGDIAATIIAENNIKTIMSKSDFTGVVRADNIKSLTAMNMDSALVSVSDEITSVNIKGDVIDSYVLAGYDIGYSYDVANVQDDELSDGKVKKFSFKGEFRNTYVTSGVMPEQAYSSLFGFQPQVADVSVGVGSSVDRVLGKLENIATDNGGIDFGFFSSGEIKTKLPGSGDFVILGNM